jgi:hypothetical protein
VPFRSKFVLPIFLILSGMGQAAELRVWSDAAGKTSTEATLVDFDDETVVLKRHSGKLIALPIADLSKIDQDYLHSKAASTAIQDYSKDNRTWTLRDGTEIVGRVINYGRKPVVIQRQTGKILVNGRLYQDFNKLQQYMVRQIVEHFDETPIKDTAALERWAIKQGAEPREFLCEGVLIKGEDREELAVPFFLFTSDDDDFLRPGWENWKTTADAIAKSDAQSEEAKQRQASLFLRARTKEYQRDQATRQMVDLMTVTAGLANEWQVTLYPRPGTPGLPMQVLVMGHDSREATVVAADRYPGYFVGPVSKYNQRR